MDQGHVASKDSNPGFSDYKDDEWLWWRSSLRKQPNHLLLFSVSHWHSGFTSSLGSYTDATHVFLVLILVHQLKDIMVKRIRMAPLQGWATSQELLLSKWKKTLGHINENSMEIQFQKKK